MFTLYFPINPAIPFEEALANMNKNSDDDGTIPEPPPSRGTVLTFSDVTEYTFADSHSQYTSTSRAMTR